MGSMGEQVKSQVDEQACRNGNCPCALDRKLRVAVTFAPKSYPSRSWRGSGSHTLQRHQPGDGIAGLRRSRARNRVRKDARTGMQGGFPFPVKYGYCAVGVVVAGPPELLEREVFCLSPASGLFRRAGRPHHRLAPRIAGTPARCLRANMETALNIVWDARDTARRPGCRVRSGRRPVVWSPICRRGSPVPRRFSSTRQTGRTPSPRPRHRIRYICRSHRRIRRDRQCNSLAGCARDGLWHRRTGGTDR